MASKIKDFYRNKNILITGGTGFMGLGFVEKILRSFPEVGDIFMIVRGRQGQSIQQRKELYVKNPVFSRLNKEQSPDYSKLKWIEGDLRKVNLGLSHENITKLQSSVNMIIHSAATVKFNAPLKDAIVTNISATNDLLNIASGCQNFDCFMHISTVYCKARRGVNHLDETIYKHPISPTELIQIANRLTADELNAKTNEFIQDWPNTYTYSKNAAENLCESKKHEFPIAIYRPGVVVSSYTEPLPYWIGNNMAFARIMREANRGLVLDALPHVNGNCVPVDMTVNGMLMAAYRTAIDKKFNIYNYTTNNNPYEYTKCFDNFVKNVPGYQELILKRKELLNMKNPKPGSYEEKMIKLINQYQKFHETALYFLRNQFTYSNDNIDEMWDKMADDERKLLPFDLRGCNWPKFYTNMNNNLYGTNAITF